MNLISAKLWLTITALVPLSGTMVLSSTASGDTIQCIGEASCYSSRSSGSTPDSDLITGTEFLSENIIALARNDVVYAFGGANYIEGDEDSDFIDAGPGSDVVDGGSEDDTIVGREGDDRLEANLGNDRVLGGAGNDMLSGSIGDDNLVGNEGHDDFYGGPGSDHFWCDSGTDTIHDYSQAEGDKIMSEADCEIVRPFSLI